MLMPAIATAEAVLAAAAGYQSMSPAGQWCGRTFTGLPFGSKQLALTYDDGPNDPHTLRLLEVLAKHGVRATFFLIGQFVQRRPDVVRQLVQQGHIVGNHTYTHPLLIFKQPADIQTEIEKCEHAIRDAIGTHSNIFRPPFGGRRPEVLRIARKLNLKPVMWNITGYDWNAPSADYIERKVSRGIKGGNVILLHDGGHKELGADRAHTVKASGNLILRFKSEGYEFVTIPDMMRSQRSK